MKDSHIPGQGEFFDEYKAAHQPKSLFSQPEIPAPSVGKKLTITKEIAILVLIVILILMAVAYSMGIERGSKNKNTEPAEVKLAEIKVKEIAPPAAEPVKELLPEETVAVVEEIIRPYGIQVISFKSDSLAQEEMDELKARGYKSFMKKIGRYYEVSVGEFLNRQEAEPTIEELKSVYPDCYLIRRIK